MKLAVGMKEVLIVTVNTAATAAATAAKRVLIGTVNAQVNAVIRALSEMIAISHVTDALQKAVQKTNHVRRLLQTPKIPIKAMPLLWSLKLVLKLRPSKSHKNVRLHSAEQDAQRVKVCALLMKVEQTCTQLLNSRLRLNR
jgi:ABC-type multidrug transport system fused ATPase/permease subunit